jgi:hypothetical protein
MGLRKSLGAIAIALPVIGCVWTVYANTVGASVYPTVGEWRDEPTRRSAPERTSFAARFEPLAAAAQAAPQLMASIALKAAMTRQAKGVQVASADPNDVPVTSAVNAAEPAKTGHRYYALLDPGYSFGFQPDRFKQPQNNQDGVAEGPASASSKVAMAPSSVKDAMNVPLPPQRKSIAAVRANPSRNPFSHESLVARAKAAILVAAQNHKSSFFEKLFGKPDAPALAYASADSSDMDVGTEPRDNAFNPSDEDRYTAVYDISAKTVYMPDGSKLEAHSGLGGRLDDPRYANVKMQGVTPPHIYDLKLREKLFHGVAAIRLNPVGGEDVIYGRTGLLAHTYMLGPRGDSNGCVSFKDYTAFLQAFKRGEVKRLVVVGSMT